MIIKNWFSDITHICTFLSAWKYYLISLDSWSIHFNVKNKFYLFEWFKYYLFNIELLKEFLTFELKNLFFSCIVKEKEKIELFLFQTLYFK